MVESAVVGCVGCENEKKKKKDCCAPKVPAETG